MDDWGNFASEIFKGTVKTAVQFQINDAANSRGLRLNESGDLVAVPSATPQRLANSVSPTGQPFKIFYKEDGGINPVAVGAVGLFAVLMLRAV